MDLLEGLRLDVVVLAGLVGAHPSSVYRWRAAGAANLRIDPGSLRLLYALEAIAGAAPDDDARQGLGAELTSALVMRGPLYGIYRLLESYFGGAPSPMPTASSTVE